MIHYTNKPVFEPGNLVHPSIEQNLFGTPKIHSSLGLGVVEVKKCNAVLSRLPAYCSRCITCHEKTLHCIAVQNIGTKDIRFQKIHTLHTLHTYIHTYIHTCIHTYIHIYIYICTYIHIYIHTYIHTYIHVLGRHSYVATSYRRIRMK